MSEQRRRSTLIIFPGHIPWSEPIRPRRRSPFPQVAISRLHTDQTTLRRVFQCMV